MIRAIATTTIVLFGCAGTWTSDRDTWIKLQIGLEASALASTACDGGETSQFLRESHWQETNPILGSHPSGVALWGYLGGVSALLVGVDYLFDRYIHGAAGPILGSIAALGVTGIEVWSNQVNMHVGAGFCGVDPGGPWRTLPDGTPGAIAARR